MEEKDKDVNRDDGKQEDKKQDKIKSREKKEVNEAQKKVGSKLTLKILVVILLAMCILLLIKLYVTERDNKLLNKDTLITQNSNSNDVSVVDQEEVTNKKSLLDNFFMEDIINKPSYSRMIRFPSSYTGLKITTTAVVKEIISETDADMTVKANIIDNEGESDKKLVLIKYKKSDNIRLIKDDIINFVGTFNGIDASSQLPSISASKIVLTPNGEADSIYTFEEIETIAKNFFGDNITVTKPTYTEEELNANPKLRQSHWIVKLNKEAVSQTLNDTYRIYDILREIEDSENKEGVLERQIKLDSSLNGYITIEKNFANNRVTLSYYDSKYNEKWKKNWDNVLINPEVVAKNGKIYIRVKSDIYVLNEKTGEELINPISVAEKGKLQVDSYGNIFYSVIQKSGFTTMYDSKGNIKWKNDCPATAKPIYIDNIITDNNQSKVWIVYNTGNNENLSEEELKSSQQEVVVYNIDTGERITYTRTIR